MKKILLDNPKVLAIFVKDCQMTVKEVKMVEKMISPDVELLVRNKCNIHARVNTC